MSNQIIATLTFNLKGATLRSPEGNTTHICRDPGQLTELVQSLNAQMLALGYRVAKVDTRNSNGKFCRHYEKAA